MRSSARKSFAAVIVFPLAGVHRAAAQADDHRQMLYADRTLEFAGAAGGALERRFLRNVFAQQRLFGAGSVFVQVPRSPRMISFGLSSLAGVVGRTMLGAASALHAGVSLQTHDLGQILAGDQAEVFVARPAAESG